MELGLNGKRALVTGGSRGLGRAVASGLRAEGAEVAICAREEHCLRAVAAQIGAAGFTCDLTMREAASTLVKDVIDTIGRIDILVANIGGPPIGDFESLDDVSWSTAFNDMFMSIVGLIRACLPGMKSRGWGRIMVVTSVSAREPLPKLMLSNAIRPSLHGLINALSREVAADGVTVNALMPGYTLTERLREVGVDEAQVSQQIPARRMGRPEEFAALAVFLASEPAGYICGQAIACDGGLLRSI